MPAKKRHAWLVIGLFSLLGCASLSEPPSPSGPYAVLSFPASIQLLALNTQQFDPRFPVTRLRVNPGQYTLQFAYTAVGPGHSASHNGQHAAPFTLDVHEGLIYHFAAKTWGIIWRPEVASTTTIAHYCQTHACTTVAQQPAQLPTTEDCR